MFSESRHLAYPTQAGHLASLSDLSAFSSGHGLAAPDIPDIAELQKITRGDPRICVAVLDGAVDLAHPDLASALISELPVAAPTGTRPHLADGTRTAGIVFGESWGIAPHCRGLVVPIFNAADDPPHCSQVELARGILLAAAHGAHVINISAGQFAYTRDAHPMLADVVRYCAERGILLIAAAESSECLHVPGAFPSVLPVGVLGPDGIPLVDGWSDSYREIGILAPGSDIAVPSLGGGRTAATGASVATAVVSGVCALLLSLQVKLGMMPNPARIRGMLVGTARRTPVFSNLECERMLGGRLNVADAVSLVYKEDTTRFIQLSAGTLR